jgi:hypothetical protein
MLISGVGSVLFIYGKKEGRLPHMLAGGVYCLYPYFVHSLAVMLLIGAVLGVGLYYGARLDG